MQQIHHTCIIVMSKRKIQTFVKSNSFCKVFFSQRFSCGEREQVVISAHVGWRGGGCSSVYCEVRLKASFSQIYSTVACGEESAISVLVGFIFVTEMTGGEGEDMFEQSVLCIEPYRDTQISIC
jgi:hypothetical protein